MKNEIMNILSSKLKNGFVFDVAERNFSIGSGPYLQIWAACSNDNINGVAGQKAQVVSLCLDLTTLELNPQIYGGNGGRSIHRIPNLNDPSEKYLAMKSVKIPFRTPLKEKKNVLMAIEKFVDNYLKTLRENKSVLMYKNMIDYDTLLS